MLVITPGRVLAEVSDKAPTSISLWLAGVITALLCLAASCLRPWLGTIISTAFSLWCLGVIMEIHSPDIMPHLQAVQGLAYYSQAYVAFSLPFCGLILGVLCYRRKMHRK